MIYFGAGSESHDLGKKDVREGLAAALQKIGGVKKVMVVPPDITRLHSYSGEMTRLVWEYYGDKLTDIMPALGTHAPMSDHEIDEMFGPVPKELFRIHDWRKDAATVGEVPGSFIREISKGQLDFSWPVQVNKFLMEGGRDLILSIGQVVPHEVLGMANHSKNILIGLGGAEAIHLNHYLGAVYGLERVMGRVDTPTRRMLNYAAERFLSRLPIVYIQTVIGRDSDSGDLKVRGLYIGDYEAFEKAAGLSIKVNFEILDKPLKKALVYLPPSEYKTTWLGNKSVYRTRMAMADGGELIVLAPGLKTFGEDKTIDKLIRKHGYRTTHEILRAVQKNENLINNLSAAAHLIHGSSENRFSITYCPGHLTRAEIEGVNYRFSDLKETLRRYPIDELEDGFNIMPDGEEIFLISNPALGLWAYSGRL